jgi:hypothetical protein
MEMSLPTKETLTFWKQELQSTVKSSPLYPHSGFGYYRSIAGRENGTTFTDLIPLPTELSLTLIENLYNKQRQVEDDVDFTITNDDERKSYGSTPYYMDLPPCLRYKYFYPPTEQAASGISSPINHHHCTPPPQRKFRSAAGTTLFVDEVVSNTPSAADENLEDNTVPAAATIIAPAPTPKKYAAVFVAYFRTKLQKIVEALILERCNIVQQDLKSDVYYDISTITDGLLKLIQDKETIAYPVSFMPKVLCGLGFTKRFKRAYDQNGVRRTSNEWNFPLDKLTAVLAKFD